MMYHTVAQIRRLEREIGTPLGADKGLELPTEVWIYMR